MRVLLSIVLATAALLVATDRLLLPLLPFAPRPRERIFQPESAPSTVHFARHSLTLPRAAARSGGEEFARALIPLGPGVYRKVVAPGVEERIEGDRWMQRDPDFAIRERPRAEARHQLTEGQKFIFDVRYRSDEYGRRITPREEGLPRTQFLASWGCSLTYGHGVGESETVPSHLGRIFPNHVPYNYGACGKGPDFALALLRKRDLRREIREERGVGLYLYIDDQLGRVTGDSFWATLNPRQARYELNAAGKVQRVPPLAEAHPLRTFFYRLFEKGGLAKLGFVWPPMATTQDIELICAILDEMGAEFRGQKPGSRFYVAFLPDAAKDYDPLTACLARKGTATLDLRNAYEGYDVPLTLPHDGHPTAAANQAVAHAIRDLLAARDPSVPLN